MTSLAGNTTLIIEDPTCTLKRNAADDSKAASTRKQNVVSGSIRVQLVKLLLMRLEKSVQEVSMDLISTSTVEEAMFLSLKTSNKACCCSERTVNSCLELNQQYLFESTDGHGWQYVLYANTETETLLDMLDDTGSARPRHHVLSNGFK